MGVWILEGLASDCSEALFERYCEALDGGYSGASILAVVEPRSRDAWLDRLAGSLRSRQEDRIMTPFSWVKRELELWWPRVEEHSTLPPPPAGLRADLPLFVQIDMAQYLMERITAPYRARTGAFAASRTPEALRYVHLLDTLARGVENQLSPAEAIARLLAAARPVDRQGLADVAPCIDLYREELLRHRILDQALAWELFATVLLEDPLYRAHLATTTRVLLVEALDEATPVAAHAYEIVADGCPEVFLGIRQDGAQRDFVGADAAGARARWPQAVTVAVPPRSPSLASLGQSLHRALAPQHLAGSDDDPDPETPRRLPGVPVPARPSRAVRGRDVEQEDGEGGRDPSLSLEDPLVTREFPGYLEMLAAVVDDLAITLRDLPPADVAIVAPALDPLLIFWLRSKITGLGHELVVRSGSHRLLDHPPAAALLTLARLGVGPANPERSDGAVLDGPAMDRGTSDRPGHLDLGAPARHEWLALLERLTDADAFALAPIADRLATGSGTDLDRLAELVARDLADLSPLAIEALPGWVLRERSDPSPSLSALLGGAFAAVLGPCLVARDRKRRAAPTGSLDPDASPSTLPRQPTGAADGERAAIQANSFGTPARLSEASQRELGHMAQLIDTAERFDAVLDRLGTGGTLTERVADFARFLASGAIADRPYFGRQPHRDAVVLATASWFAQMGDSVAVQFWLDTRALTWRKSDVRELTNPMALRRERPEGPYLLTEEERDQDSKLGRTILACCARVTRQIRAYASLVDAAGREQTGALGDVLGDRTSDADAAVGAAS